MSGRGRVRLPLRIWRARLPLRRSRLWQLAGALAASAAVSWVMARGNPEACLTRIYGGACFLPSGIGPDLVGAVAALAPTFVLAYLPSDFLTAELACEAAAVLPRAGSRARWAAARAAQLALMAAAFGVLAPAVGVALTWAGSGVAASELVFPLAQAMLLGALGTAMLVLLVNRAALVWGSVPACVGVLGAHAAVLLSCAWLPEEVAAAFAWALPSVTAQLAFRAPLGLPAGPPVGFSALYLLLVCVLVGAGIVRAARRRDVV